MELHKLIILLSGVAVVLFRVEMPTSSTLLNVETKPPQATLSFLSGFYSLLSPPLMDKRSATNDAKSS